MIYNDAQEPIIVSARARNSNSIKNLNGVNRKFLFSFLMTILWTDTSGFWDERYVYNAFSLGKTRGVFASVFPRFKAVGTSVAPFPFAPFFRTHINL